jgi:glycosidase
MKLIVHAYLCILLLGFSSLSIAGPIDRIEPPFWYSGFQHSELQIMIYGEDAGALEVEVDYPGVSLNRLVRTDNPNYLFVYLDLQPGVEPGTFELVFSNDDWSVREPYELKARSEDPAHTRGFGPGDAIYLITPDRFANGNPDNDNIEGMGDPVDRSNWGGRHGGDLEGIEERLDYIGDMGFTAIWLNPVLENRMPEYSYHGYSTTDFYRVDPRYGSNEEYQALAATAKEQGIGLIMDMIVNHIGSGHWWMQDIPHSNWLNDPVERRITTHQRATNQDPYVSQQDLRDFTEGWFVKTMPDLNQRNPLLADYLIQNAIWWIEYLGLAGVRHDTHPYPDKHFMTEWGRRIMQEFPEFNIVGEEWSNNPVIVSYWQAGKQNRDGYVSHLPSMMDFPVQETLVDVLTSGQPDWGSPWGPLYVLLANDVLYPDPFNLVVFPDNHDMSRIFTQLGEDFDLWKMAMAYTLTIRGIPQIYYGTEILMSNPGADDHGLIRSDFPGGWKEDDTDAVSGKGISDQSRAAQVYLRQLLNWRKESEEIAHGRLMQFAPIEETYVYFRYTDKKAVMVAFNRGEEPVELTASRFSERLGNANVATDVITGEDVDISEVIPVPARSVRVLEIVVATGR